MGMKSLEQYRVDFIDVIKRQLGSAIRAKGGTVNDTDAWSAFVSAVSTLAKVGSKNFAKGQTTPNSSTSFSIHGLSFAPSFVVIFNGEDYMGMFDKGYLTGSTIKALYYNSSRVGSNTTVIWANDGLDITVSVSGIRSGYAYYWVAIE